MPSVLVSDIGALAHPEVVSEGVLSHARLLAHRLEALAEGLDEGGVFIHLAHHLAPAFGAESRFIETAAVVQNFAEYMVASEEIEPSGGLDYKALAESFAKETDSLEVGKTICDSFMEKCKKSNKDDISTLSLVNLSKLNPIFDHMDSLGKSLSEFVGKDNAFSKVISAAKRCEKFGYDSVFSGSSNMIDFLDFGKLVVLSDFDAFSKVYDIVEEAVVYSVTGEQRDNGGISFYYPIDYDETEMTEYISLGISEPYNKFLSTYYLIAPDETIAFSD